MLSELETPMTNRSSNQKEQRHKLFCMHPGSVQPNMNVMLFRENHRVHVPDDKRLRHRLRLSSIPTKYGFFNLNAQQFTMAAPKNSLRGFMSHAKSALQSAISSNGRVTIVIGNESAGQRLACTVKASAANMH